MAFAKMFVEVINARDRLDTKGPALGGIASQRCVIEWVVVCFRMNA